ncbi:MAG TPA: lactonase family protein [Bryobacteraceae bacterium]
MKLPFLFLFLLLTSLEAQAAKWIVYVGTYTSGDSKGIYAFRFNDSSGTLTPMGLAAETPNPSFLAVGPDRRFLYAANEETAGGVSAFAIDTGELKLLNRVSSRGSGPCHVALDKTGKWLFVANYNSGSVAAFPVHIDGSLGEASAFMQHSGSSVNPQRQEGPHAHSVNVSPDNRFVLVADLGLDEILTYPIDAAKGLVQAESLFKVQPGSGPRHLVFGTDSRFAYAINEMLGTVTAFQYDAAKGKLKELQTIPSLPAGFSGANSSAEIAVHPGGKFLYASNRGDSSIAIFRIDAAKGTLSGSGHVSTGGNTPRNFAIDPSGKFLLAANQDSGNIVVFRIDQKTGAVTPAGVEAKVAAPVSIVYTQAR